MQTTGDRELDALLSKMRGAGADVAPFEAAARRLGTQLKTLEDQQQLINTFTRAKEANVQAAQGMQQAQIAAQRLGRELSATAKPTKAQTKEFERARKAVADAKQEWIGSVSALEKARSALEQVGIQSGKLAAHQVQLRASAAQAHGEMATLTQKLQTVASGLSKVDSAGGQANAGLTKTRQGLESISTQLAQTQKHIGTLRDSLLAGFSAQQFVQAAADMEKFQVGLQAVSGDAALAKEQMNFVRQMATRAGVDVGAAAQAFLGLAAATKGTAVEGEPTRKVFEAVSTAMAKAGKSSAETQNALLALSQIASKGTVSMEELRGQLGEALPGALQAAANGLGITTQDLIKLVENGKVAAEDLFPALATGLNALYGGAPAAQTLSQEIVNIKNAFLQMADTIGQAGGLDALKTGAEVAQTAITFLGESLTVTGQQIGVLVAAVANMDFSRFSEAMAEIEQASRERLLKAAEHNTVLAAAIKATGDEAINAALATKGATDQIAQGAASASSGLLKLGADYAKVREEVSASVELAGKELEATKAKTNAAVEHAKLLGDEGKLRQAVAKAALDEAAAAEDLAKKKETEVAVMRAELEARKVLMELEGSNSQQRTKEIEELQKLIAQKDLDAQKTRAQADALKEKAKAHSEEAVAAEGMRKAAETSLITRKAEAGAALEVANSQKVVADSLVKLAELSGNDEQIRQARIKAIEAEIAVTKAKADVMRVEAQGAIDVAKATVDELRVRGELTKQKEAELNATIKLNEARLKMAQATGQSTEAQQKLLDALRSGAGATGTNTNATNTDTQARKANRGAIDAQADALQRLNTINSRYSAPGQGAKPSKPGDSKDDYDPGYGSQYSNPNDPKPVNGLGETKEQYDRRQSLKGQNAVDNTLSFKIRDKLQSGTLAASDLGDVQNVIAALKQNQQMDSFARQMGGLSTAAIEDSQRWSNLIPLLEEFVRRQKTEASGSSGGASTTTTAKTYNVTIGSQTVRTVSDADAQTLMALLAQAQRAA